MQTNKLFMLLLGCTPVGRHTEQHDIFFGIGNDLKSLVPDIIQFWAEAAGKIHIDAWQEVTQVGEFDIQVVSKNQAVKQRNEKLFFLNLGGYKEKEFDEFHYKLLSVANTKGDAIREAKQTAFYKHMNVEGTAVSHIDDQYGVDVDDIFEIEDVLSPELKERFAIQISKATAIKKDKMNLGYLPLSKLI